MACTRYSVRSFTTGGSGKSGGSGGSIREAGGAFGKMEAGREEEYFHKVKRAQFKALKDQLAKELEHHEQQAKNHVDVASRHKKRMAELDEELGDEKK